MDASIILILWGLLLLWFTRRKVRVDLYNRGYRQGRIDQARHERTVQLIRQKGLS